MINLNNKKIFVAGASGMVGRALVNRLLKTYPKAKIHAICYSQNQLHFQENDNLKILRGDLRSLEDCRRMCAGCEFAIMAAAATGGAAQSTKAPWMLVNDNTIMNAQMLHAFHEEGIARVLQIGSATCYQPFEGSIREEELDWAKDPHEAHFGIGWVTRYLEKLAQFWHLKFGMQVVLVRAANVFGPFAQFDPQRSNFIPALIRKAVDKMDPFQVWGSPKVTRDVIYSEDFAKAGIALLSEDSIAFDVFNIGSGVATQVGEAVQQILSSAGHDPSSIDYIGEKPSNIKHRVLDCSKLKSVLKKEEAFSLANGIDETVSWWSNNKEIWRR